MKKLSELVLEKVVINYSVLRSLTPVDKGAEVGDIEKNVHCFARIVLQVLSLGWDWSLIVKVGAHQAEVELGDCVDLNPEKNHPRNSVNQKDTDRLKVL